VNGVLIAIEIGFCRVLSWIVTLTLIVIVIVSVSVSGAYGDDDDDLIGGSPVAQISTSKQQVGSPLAGLEDWDLMVLRLLDLDKAPNFGTGSLAVDSMAAAPDTRGLRS